MSNLTRRNFFGVSAVVAGLGITACKKSDSDAGEKKESDTNSTDAVGAPEELVKAAKEEGKLIVYGSCEEEYINAVCANFKSLYGIDVQAQRLSTGEVAAKIEEENGHPSADVWFGGTTDPYNVTSSKGLLEQYEPKNASHLISDKFKSTNKDWYGIYKGILGILYDKEELQRLKLDVPQDYKDLIDPKYKGLIWSSNYNTAGTAKLIINTVIQKYGHDQGIQYLVDLIRTLLSTPRVVLVLPRQLEQASAPSELVCSTTAFIRLLTKSMRMLVFRFQALVHHTRLVQPQSSRVLHIQTQLNSGLSMHSRQHASILLRRTALISSW